MVLRPARLIAVALALVALSGCAAVKGVVPPQEASGRYVIHALGNLTFDPVEAKIPRGATVVWINDGTVAHDVNGYPGDPPKTDFPTFTSGVGSTLPPGGSFTHTFTESGTYTIWCHTHHEERMKGILHVS